MRSRLRLGWSSARKSASSAHTSMCHRAGMNDIDIRTGRGARAPSGRRRVPCRPHLGRGQRRHDGDRARRRGTTATGSAHGTATDASATSERSASTRPCPAAHGCPPPATRASGCCPTHTRRGLLTQMMQRSLRESRDRGQVLASLRASESPIYGRFGYGLAGDFVSVHIISAKTRPLRGTRATGSMRLLRLDEVLEVVPPLYDRVARRWVGTIDRPPWMWKRYLKEATEPASAPFGKGEFVAVHADPNRRRRRLRPLRDRGWSTSSPHRSPGPGTIHDLWGVRRRGRTRALAVPVRHRPGHHLAGRRSVRSTIPIRRDRSSTCGPTRHTASSTSSGSASSTSTPRSPLAPTVRAPTASPSP